MATYASKCWPYSCAIEASLPRKQSKLPSVHRIDLRDRGMERVERRVQPAGQCTQSYARKRNEKSNYGMPAADQTGYS